MKFDEWDASKKPLFNRSLPLPRVGQFEISMSNFHGVVQGILEGKGWFSFPLMLTSD